jgi:hypothetical protein
MNQSNSASRPSAPRVTLKLKAGVRRNSDEIKTSSTTRPQSQQKHKPGAAWSDDYKRSMQEEMDALASR